MMSMRKCGVGSICETRFANVTSIIERHAMRFGHALSDIRRAALALAPHNVSKLANGSVKDPVMCKFLTESVNKHCCPPSWKMSIPILMLSRCFPMLA